ncbi:MAG: chain length-determining protein, partial [Desulfuromonadales bacterium]|nr:chain length-determining protein [Desulfuromonadales bacterium]
MNASLQEFIRYLNLIYKRRYLFISVSLLVMTMMLAWSYTRPKLYEAASTVFIESNVINNLVEGIAVTPDMDERIGVLRYALLSRGLLTRVLEKLGHPVISGEDNKVEPFVNGLIKRINIEVKKNELFIVSIVDSDPNFAQDFINMLVSTYVEESLSGTRAETYGAKRFLDEQIDFFREKLEKTEDAIIDFRKNQGIFVTINEDSIISDLRQYQREVEELNISLATLTA